MIDAPGQLAHEHWLPRTFLLGVGQQDWRAI